MGLDPRVSEGRSGPDLGLAHLEVLIAVVDDGVFRAAGADEADTLAWGEPQRISQKTAGGGTAPSQQQGGSLSRHLLPQGSTLVLAASSTAFSVDTPSLG